MNKIKQLAPLKTEPNEDHQEGITRFRYHKTTTHKRIKSESVTDRLQEDLKELRAEATQKFRTQTKPERLGQGMVQQDPRAVEEWIGDMLIQAEGGIYDNASRRDTLRRYGIDKKTLKNYGLDLECITRLHRSMFIYTFGFHRMLLDTLSTVKERDTVLLKYWRVYTILLQYSSKEDYMTVLSQQEKEYKAQIDVLKKRLQQQQTEYEKMHTQEQFAISKMTTEFSRLKNDNVNYLLDQEDQLQHDKKHIELTLLAREEAFNDEIARRVKFENKLNTIYSVHKELLTKHSALMEDLKTQRLKNDTLEQLIEEKDQLILNLKETILHLQSQVTDLTDELIKVKNHSCIIEQTLEISKSQLHIQLQKLNDGEKQEKENQLSKDTLNIKMNQAFSQVYLLNDEIKTLKAQNQAITTQRDDINQQLILSTKQKEELQLKLLELNHDYQIINQTLKNLELTTSQKIEYSEKASIEIVEQSLQIKKLESDHSYLDQQLNLKDQVISELRGGVQKLVMEQEKALERIKEYERRIQIYSIQVQEQEKKLQNMRAEITQVSLLKTEAELQVNLLKNQLFVTQQEDEKIIESLNTKNVAFSQENLRHVSTISGLSKTIMLLRGNVMNLQTDIDRLLMNERSLTIENAQLKELSSQFQRSYEELEQRLQLQSQEQNKDQYEVFHLKRKVFAISLLLKLISASMGRFALETFIETSQRQVNNNSFGIDAKSQINVKSIFESLLEIDHDLYDPSLYQPQQGAIKFSEFSQNQDLIVKIEQYKLAKFNMEKERDGYKRMAIMMILLCKKKYLETITLKASNQQFQEREVIRDIQDQIKSQQIHNLKSVLTQTEGSYVIEDDQAKKIKKVRTTLAGDDDLRIFQQLQEQKLKQKQKDLLQPRSLDRTINQGISDTSPNKSPVQQQIVPLNNPLIVPVKRDYQTQTSKPPTAGTSRNQNIKQNQDVASPQTISISPFDINHSSTLKQEMEVNKSPTTIQMLQFSEVIQEVPFEQIDNQNPHQTEQTLASEQGDPQNNSQLLNLNKPPNLDFRTSRSESKDSQKKSSPQRNHRKFQKLYQNASSFYSRKQS